MAKTLLEYNCGPVDLPQIEISYRAYWALKRFQVKEMLIGLLNVPLELEWAKIPYKLKVTGEYAPLGRGWVYESLSSNDQKIRHSVIVEWAIDKYVEAGILQPGWYIVEE